MDRSEFVRRAAAVAKDGDHLPFRAVFLLVESDPEAKKWFDNFESLQSRSLDRAVDRLYQSIEEQVHA